MKLKTEGIQPGSCGFDPGRYNPPQQQHVIVKKWALEEKVDRLVVGICSCYELGSVRHAIPAYQREKMLARSLRDAGVDMSRITFVHIPDCHQYDDPEKNYDEWLSMILQIITEHKVTHFFSGNEEEVTGPLKRRNLPVTFEVINPEKELPEHYKSPYHSTDMRNAIFEGNYELFEKIAASGTMDLMGSVGGFTALREALNGQGTKIIPGRQAVDLIVTCQGRIPQETFVLCGRRSMLKENFPGYLGLPGGGIELFMNPMLEALREGIEETGMPMVMKNCYVEPAHVLIANKYICEMRFVKVFGSNDTSLAGNQGGSSQVFHIHVNQPWQNLSSFIKSNSDLDDVAFRPAIDVLIEGMAYQQSDMLRMALRMI